MSFSSAFTLGYKFRRYCITYLNIGVGNAWAGHKTEMVSLVLKLKSRLFSKLGNFGETFPIGSGAKGIFIQCNRQLQILSIEYLKTDHRPTSKNLSEQRDNEKCWTL